jgi:hypothetical protein
MALLGRQAQSPRTATYNLVCYAHMPADTYDAVKKLRTNSALVTRVQVEEEDGINLVPRNRQLFLPRIEQGHDFSRQDLLNHSSRPTVLT